MTIFDDWEDVVEGTETVTITSADGVELSGITGVLRRALNRGDTTYSGMDFEGTEVVFNVPAAHLGSRQLVKHDVITDAAAQDYRVITAALLSGGSRWRCICQRS